MWKKHHLKVIKSGLEPQPLPAYRAMWLETGPFHYLRSLFISPSLIGVKALFKNPLWKDSRDNFCESAQFTEPNQTNTC